MYRNPSNACFSSRVPSLLAFALIIVSTAAANAQTPGQSDSWASCTVDEIAGTYQTSFGALECRAGGAGLDCCYGYSGDECTSAVMLKLSPGKPLLTGEWTYYNGTSGVIQFGLTDDCSLSDGLWGDKTLNSVWGVSARTSGPPPAPSPDEATTSTAPEQASPDPAGDASPDSATTAAPSTTPASPATESGAPELALAPGIWEGSLECDRGTTYVTVSTDIHPFDRRPDSAAARIDFADSPGGHPIARSHSSISVRLGRAATVVKTWKFRPMDIDSLTGKIARADLTVSADGQTMTSATFGACRSLRLNRMPAYFTRGGIDSAMDLPPILEGTVGCHGGPATYFMRLHLTPSGDTSFDGQVFLKPTDATQSDAIDAYQVIGEFAPETTELTVIGDRWIRQSRQLKEPFDFSGVIRQSGQRLVGQGPSAWGSCGIVDLHVPGTDQSQNIALPVSPVPPERWDTPSACVTLISWARQSRIENEGKSVYTQSTVAQAHEIGIGLFADERFVPFFGMPFADLTPPQRHRVSDVAEACRHQDYSASEIYESGAISFVGGFFPDRASGEWLKLKRFRLLRARLADEMAALEVRAVSESDIGPLQATMAELPERFSELWETDLAAARALIGSKIDTAKGMMIDRLEAEIAALPVGWAAFATGRRIRSEIPALGEDHGDDQAMLIAKLNAKLAAAADAVLAGIARDFADRSPGLNTLFDLRQQLESRWPELDAYVDTGKPGFKAIGKTLSRFATAAFPSFETKTRNMVDENAHFDARTRQYGSALSYYSRLVPSSRLFSGIFEPYSSHIEDLRPVPTRRDLVADDGSPTSFGLRYAVADWVDDYFALRSLIMRFDITFGQRLISFSDVTKFRCSKAASGGYWCDYSIYFSGERIISYIMSGLPSSARFTLSGLTWNLVDFPPGSGHSDLSDNYDQIRRDGDDWQKRWNDITLEGLMMN